MGTLLLVGAGGALIGLILAITLLSRDFVGVQSPTDRPIVTLAVLLLVASALFLGVIALLRSLRETRRVLGIIIAVGLIVRAVMMFSTPMLEDDWYRYLWDGAVTANGMNPYAYAPKAVAEHHDHVPEHILELGDEASEILTGVNHPHLRTIYPPVAQGVFALAYWIIPWNVSGLRIVFLVFDAATLLLILLVLGDLKISRVWCAVYWWSPLFIKEIYNSAHMDVVILPFAVAAVLFAVRSRYTLSTGFLALAAGAKLWPVILLPVILRPLLGRPRRMIAPLCLFGALLALMFVPIYVTGLDSKSGFTAYGKHWEMNDAIYMVFYWGVQWLKSEVSWLWPAAHTLTRGIVGVILVAWIALLNRREQREPLQYWDRSSAIVAALFLLSPTQFPWYYTWVLPFLAIRPRWSLLLLSALLPLYYLRFRFSELGMVQIFDNRLVFVQYVPVLLLLAWEGYRARTGRLLGGLPPQPRS